MNSIYCERLGPGLFAEPVNLLTNLAFLIVAACALRLARGAGVATFEIRLLIALCAAIGVGSMLFHSVPTRLTRVADEVPILLFQLWFLWLYMRRIASLAAAPAAGLLALYLALALYSRGFPHLANGTLIYAPALTVMVLLGIRHAARERVERWTLLAATCAFALAFALRSVDRAVCPYFPIGTHFMWHLLNAVVVYLALRVLILTQSNRGPGIHHAI